MENKDVINGIGDSKKRVKQGEFYTPTAWAAEAHRCFDECIPNWLTDYVIWDAAAGTGNLFRNLSNATINFDNVYMSTLIEDDIPLLSSMGGTAFQLDFLNRLDSDVWFNGKQHITSDAFTKQLPESLRLHLENKDPILFFMNPPYKIGKVGTTDISYKSKKAHMDGASKDLYHQFLLRITELVEQYGLTDVYVGVFGPITWHVGSSFKTFRAHFHDRFKFVYGFLLPSNEFADTSSSVSWPIGFSIYQFGKQTDTHVSFDVKQSKNGVITITGKEAFEYNRDLMSDWVKPTDITYSDERITFAKFDDLTKTEPAKYANGGIGSILLSDRIGDAAQYSMLSNCTILAKPNIFITEKNFWHAVSCFVAHRVYDQTQWQKFVKPFYAPVRETTDDIASYDQWLHDGLVYLLFSLNNRSLSIHKGQVAGVDVDFYNTLFPLSKKDFIDAITFATHSEISCGLKEDLETSVESNEFIVSQIDVAKKDWSIEARTLWNFGIEVLTDTSLRIVDSNKPQIQNWDASFWQLSKLLSNSRTNEYKTFLKSLESKLRLGLTRFKII